MKHLESKSYHSKKIYENALDKTVQKNTVYASVKYFPWRSNKKEVIYL
jgi:hypothetical protein